MRQLKLKRLLGQLTWQHFEALSYDTWIEPESNLSSEMDTWYTWFMLITYYVQLDLTKFVVCGDCNFDRWLMNGFARKVAMSNCFHAVQKHFLPSKWQWRNCPLAPWMKLVPSAIRNQHRCLFEFPMFGGPFLQVAKRASVKPLFALSSCLLKEEWNSKWISMNLQILFITKLSVQSLSWRFSVCFCMS